MDKKKILQSDILDIIFNDRNKAYGAYELRRNYEKRARKAIGGVLFLALVIASAPLIAGLLTTKENHILPSPSKPYIPRPIDVHPYVAPKPPRVIPTNPVKPPKTRPIPVVIGRPIDVPDPIDPSAPLSSGPSNPDGPSGVIPDAGPISPYTGPSGPTTPAVVDIPPTPDPTFSDFDVQQLPEYPGGEEAMMDFISSHMKYPSKAIAADAQGKVMLGFVVNKEGNIEDVQIVKSLGYGCDEEAMRVVQSMPKWKPGKNNGRPVKVYFNIPIVFEINQ